jgi:ribosomal protein L11 methyltransferase
VDDTVLRLVVGPDVDEAAGLLWSTDPVAITELDGELVAGYPDRAAAVAALVVVGTRWPASIEEPPDPAAWRDTWRAFAEPIRVGRLTVVPAWLPRPDDADLVVEVDPGLAFGMGSHPTTRLALAALQDETRPGDAVLDLGCGSGVLAIAAARLGAGRVLGVDIDDEALAATAANAARNGVDVEVARRVEGAFDLVVANISAATLVELAPMVRGLAPRLLLTGMLAGQEPAVAAEHPGHRVTAIDEDEGWVLLRLVSVPPDAGTD